MSDEKRIAEQLDNYLEQPDRDDGSLDPALKEVADALHQAASATEPRPGFINELAQQLQHKESSMSNRNAGSTRPRLRRLLAGALALAGLLLIVVVGSNLMRQPDVEPAALDMETPEPAVVAEASAGQFAGIEFRALQELSTQPEELPLYEAQLQPLPETPERAIELATSLGIQNPQVYHPSQQPTQWIVMGDDGASLSFNPTQTEFAGFYYRAAAEVPDNDIQPLPLPEATAIAEAFLENVGLLPPDYEVSERAEGYPNSSTRNLRFTPLLDGRPVAGHEATIQVDVSPDGEILSARVTPLRFVPLNETLAAQSQEAAFQKLLEGPDNYSYSFETVARAPEYQTFRPQQEQLEAGEELTVTGFVQLLVGVENGTVRAALHPLLAPTPYDLDGPLVEELRDLPEGTVIEATGTIGAAPESGRRSLELTAWEPAPDTELNSTCLQGTVTGAAGETLTFQADDARTYEIAEAPEALNEGQRVQVCSLNFDGDPVVWDLITTPPAGEVTSGMGQSSGGSARSVEAVEGVEVTRVLTEEAGGEGQSQSQSSESSSGVAVARPAGPVEGTLESVELGQTTTITGVVEGVIHEGPEGQQLQVGILAERGDDPLSIAYDYVALQGNRDRLQEIAQHYRLHVTVSGVVVPADDSRMGDKAIEVTSYSRLFPDEQIEAFLGHMEEATVDGRDVVLFVDEESGQQYVVAHGFPDVNPEQRIWVAGVVHPTRRVGDLPVLETKQQRAGDNVDRAESVGDLPPPERSVPVVRQGPDAPGGPAIEGPLVVEAVRLGYSLEVPLSEWSTSASDTSTQATPAAPLTPVWIFEGHMADGSQTFTIEIEVGEE